MLGRTRARKLRRLATETDASHEFLLKVAMDLLECALLRLRPKNREAVRMGMARWDNLSPATRSQLARAAVNARWAKSRAGKAGNAAEPQGEGSEAMKSDKVE